MTFFSIEIASHTDWNYENDETSILSKKKSKFGKKVSSFT